MKRQIGRLLTPYSAYEACLFLFVFQHILFRLKLDLPLVSASSSTIPLENGLIPMLHNCRENSLEINQLSDNASSWSTKLTPDLDIPNPITSRRMPHTKTKINIPWQRVVHEHSMIYLHDHDDSVKASYASYGIFINYSGFLINKPSPKWSQTAHYFLATNNWLTNQIHNHIYCQVVNVWHSIIYI